jgi:hypothetical protein
MAQMVAARRDSRKHGCGRLLQSFPRYRELMSVVMATSQRQQEAHARLTKAEADRATKLGDLFDR